MVRLVTLTIPKTKAEEDVLPLILQLYEEELIFQPQVYGPHTCLHLPLPTVHLPSSTSSVTSLLLGGGGVTTTIEEGNASHLNNNHGNVLDGRPPLAPSSPPSPPQQSHPEIIPLSIDQTNNNNNNNSDEKSSTNCDEYGQFICVSSKTPPSPETPPAQQQQQQQQQQHDVQKLQPRIPSPDVRHDKNDDDHIVASITTISPTEKVENETTVNEEHKEGTIEGIAFLEKLNDGVDDNHVYSSSNNTTRAGAAMVAHEAADTCNVYIRDDTDAFIPNDTKVSVAEQKEEIDNASASSKLLVTSSLIYTITLKTKDKSLQEVLTAFDSIGVGREYGQIDVVALILSKPAIAALCFAPVTTTTATTTSMTMPPVVTGSTTSAATNTMASASSSSMQTANVPVASNVSIAAAPSNVCITKVTSTEFPSVVSTATTDLPSTSSMEDVPLPMRTDTTLPSTRARNNSLDTTTSYDNESTAAPYEALPTAQQGVPLPIFYLRGGRNLPTSQGQQQGLRRRFVNDGDDDEDGRKGNSYRRNAKSRMSDRMTIEEIGSFIDDGNHLTFNYLALLACASTIAGAGLLGNSATAVIASMLVSPLMGPILSITFGLAVHHPKTIKKGIRNEVIGILLSFLTGLLMGTPAAFAYPASYRSGEMVGRGTASNLIYGFIVAFASGIAVVLGITMGGVNAIVGTAISASLLPPIVNSGMCMAMAIVYNNLHESEVQPDVIDYYMYSGISFALFVVNLVVIIGVGFCTFRYIKRVHPIQPVSHVMDTSNHNEM